jgi:uncharacterized membrane protein YuzA (DUF378 family)
MGNAMHAIRN